MVCSMFGIGHFCYDGSASTCHNCHAECRTCYGPYRTQCLTCDFNNNKYKHMI